jgi:hypothetical protein
MPNRVVGFLIRALATAGMRHVFGVDGTDIEDLDGALVGDEINGVVDELGARDRRPDLRRLSDHGRDGETHPCTRVPRSRRRVRPTGNAPGTHRPHGTGSALQTAQPDRHRDPGSRADRVSRPHP